MTKVKAGPLLLHQLWYFFFSLCTVQRSVVDSAFSLSANLRIAKN